MVHAIYAKVYCILFLCLLVYASLRTVHVFTAKPIDLLARYINAEDDEDSAAIDLHEPYTYLNVRIIPSLFTPENYVVTLLKLFFLISGFNDRRLGGLDRGHQGVHGTGAGTER